mgnify:CR=1 FL=1
MRCGGSVWWTLLLLAPWAFAGEVQVRGVVGLHEEVYLADFALVLPAKVDTGADSSSLSAINIDRFRRNGERWVRFDLAIEGVEARGVELPISRIVRIQRRAADVGDEEKDYSRRPVVRLPICVGGRRAEVDFTLADRRRFRQPLLLGVSALRALAVTVDPEADYLFGGPVCGGAEQAQRVMSWAGGQP